MREREEADLRLVGLLLGCSGLRARGGIDGLGPIRLGGSGWLVFLSFFFVLSFFSFSLFLKTTKEFKIQNQSF